MRKTKTAIIAAACALAVAACALCACGQQDDPAAAGTDAPAAAQQEGGAIAAQDGDKEAANTEKDGGKAESASAGKQAVSDGKSDPGKKESAGSASAPKQSASPGKSDPGKTSSKKHSHTWATRTVSDGKVWVVDEDEWDEKVWVGDHIHCSCGLDWYNTESYIEHQDVALCGSSVVNDYEWVHHDATGHYETKSHTETYCTGCGAVK